ncbi:MAG: multicopper oxidase domain-containing protein [Bdellovibrionales bacterium]
MRTLLRLTFILFCISIFDNQAWAKTVRYELTVENKPMNMSGKKEVDFALTVNGGIPAPILEFTEGDDAEILVINKVPNEEVSIHWHGILLPPEEDGVAYVNTPPIHPGTSRLFKFKIRQNGTYWYHSHTTVQEQKGVYGAFIIHPKKKAIAYDRDVVVVLSDWSDENADQIIRNLRKDGDFYLYKKDSVRTIGGAIKAGALKNYIKNEWDRMGGMDLSDVGYDAFLINGKRDSQLLVAHPGEKIRIRIINAGASSYFYVSMGVPMQIISADGVDVKPVYAKEILMGMAETYDVLFTVPEHKNYELKATVQDVTGFASGWIGMGEKVSAPNKPLPDLYASMDHMGHGGGDMSGMDHSKHEAAPTSEANLKMDHSKHTGDGSHAGHSDDNAKKAAPSDPHAGHGGHGQHQGHSQPKVEKPKKLTTDHSAHSAVATHVTDGKVDFTTQSDAMLEQNASSRDIATSTKVVLETLTVDGLTALKPTTLPKDGKVHELKLVLDGSMERYIWHINGKAISEDRLLLINKGEIVRFIFQNETMMHHPMHLHGHFFRVLNEQGDKSPLKHTVDVPPHGTRTIEFYANEPGQWMLHCHNLYHMKTGMARVVRYNDFKLTPEMEKHDKHDPHLHEHIYTSGLVEAATNHARAEFKLMRTWDELELKLESRSNTKKNFAVESGWDLEGDLLYRRWFGNFLNVMAGGTHYHEEGFGMIGVGYVLPMLIETQVFANHEGKFRLDVEKRFQWTKSIFTDAEFSWRPKWEGENESEFEVSIMYGPSWYWSAGLMLTNKSVGVGAQVQF